MLITDAILPRGYLSLRQVSRRLGKRETTIGLWARQGRFKGARKFGKVWGVPCEAVRQVEREIYRSKVL